MTPAPLQISLSIFNSVWKRSDFLHKLNLKIGGSNPSFEVPGKVINRCLIIFAGRENPLDVVKKSLRSTTRKRRFTVKYPTRFPFVLANLIKRTLNARSYKEFFCVNLHYSLFKCNAWLKNLNNHELMS